MWLWTSHLCHPVKSPNNKDSPDNRTHGVVWPSMAVVRHEDFKFNTHHEEDKTKLRAGPHQPKVPRAGHCTGRETAKAPAGLGPRLNGGAFPDRPDRLRTDREDWTEKTDRTDRIDRTHRALFWSQKSRFSFVQMMGQNNTTGPILRHLAPCFVCTIKLRTMAQQHGCAQCGTADPTLDSDRAVQQRIRAAVPLYAI